MTQAAWKTDARALVRDLEKLGPKLETRIAKRAVGFAATPIARAMRQAAPIGETGNLRKSIGKKSKAYQSGTSVALVGPRISDSHLGFHGHLVERGHVNRDGSYTPAHPFMEPAAEQAKPEARARLLSKLQEEIRKELARR